MAETKSFDTEPKPKVTPAHGVPYNQDVRVCPYNSTHVIRLKRFSHHCSTCPDRPEAAPCFGKAYISIGINTIAQLDPLLRFDLNVFVSSQPGRNGPGFAVSESLQSTVSDTLLRACPQETAKSLSDISQSPDLFHAFSQLVDALYAELNNGDVFPSLSEYFAVYDADAAADVRSMSITLPQSWAKSDKHAPQCESIIAHLVDYGVICVSGADTRGSESACILEAGSGTGMLSSFIAQVNSDPECKQAVRSHIDSLFDRDSSNTHDSKKMVCPRSDFTVHMSGKHQRVFYLVERDRGYRRKFDRYIRAAGEPVHRVSCDLCDLDLAKLLCDEADGPSAYRGALAGGVTHCGCAVIGKHLCGSGTDVTLKMAADCPCVHGIGIALCCHSKGDSRNYINNELFESLHCSRGFVDLLHKAASWPLAFRNRAKQPFDMAREALGRRCRVLLDIGRVCWLLGCGFRVKIVKYTTEDISPECYLLLARRAATPQCLPRKRSSS